MDLKQYYERIQQVRKSIRDDFPLVISLATPDGGKAGTKTEVTKEVASRMVVEGLARLADAEETAAHRQEKSEARRVAEEKEAASRLQVRMISEEDFRSLRGPEERRR